MGYAEECERWAGLGFSGSEAAEIAGSGVRPEIPDDNAVEMLVNRMLDRDYERERETT